MSKQENKKQKSSFWRNRFRITVQEESTFQERKTFLFSGRGLVAILSGCVLFVGFVAYFMITQTALTKFVVPGYIARSFHEDAGLAKAQADSALNLLKQHERYISSLQVILDGGVPDYTDATNLDSVLKNKGGIPDAGEVDKNLRERVEGEDRFALKRHRPIIDGGAGFSLSPLSGIVSDGFDLSRGHLGIDLVSAEGELIRSVDDGVVVISSYTAENGYVIVVQHNNDRLSVYKHNSALLKEVGDFVKAGDPVATVGSSGRESSGPHLHFEWWVKGRPVDPSPWLKN